MSPSSILVISVARIGDTILLTPSLKAIKKNYPGAKLTVMAHPRRIEVLEHLPAIDCLVPITKSTAIWRGWLAPKQHDLAFVYGKDAALVRYALRVSAKVVCFDEDEFKGLTSPSLIRVAPPADPVHAVLHRLMLLGPAGIDRVDDLRLTLGLTDEEKAFADSSLEALGLSHMHPLVGLQMFSFPAKAHRDWPIASFEELIQALGRAYPNARFVILGDALAADRAAPVLLKFPDRVISVAGKFSLRQSAAFMARLDLYVGVDTGPTHIAGALGIPMVAMYHWKYPAKYLCPLMNEGCISIPHPHGGDIGFDGVSGMEAIAVEPVLKAAKLLIANRMNGAA